MFLKNIRHIRISKLMKNGLLKLIKFYQYSISPLLGPNCRFTPSCSQYTYKAITTYGALKGSYLGIKRILKCNPFHPGGYDPVPCKNKNYSTNEKQDILRNN